MYTKKNKFNGMKKLLFLNIFLVVCGLHLYAQGITMQFNGTVQQAIETLQSRSGYSVVIRTQGIDMNRRVSINAVDQEIGRIVAAIFETQDIAFTIEGRNILITERVAQPQPVQQAETLITVTGRVVDQFGDALPGAIVQQLATDRGTVTDHNGFYSLQVPANAQISITFIGFEDQVIDVNGRTVINAIMHEMAMLMDELIVVGYGVMRRSDVTGAVAQINMAANETRQAISLADHLRGTVAGLNIARSASITGQTTFEIRGQSTIGASNEPLIVVDGMIYHGSVNDINPHDVETVTVLKDASSAAVFGASAAGGVILITTRRGTSERPVIRFSARHSRSILQNIPGSYDVEGYLRMRGDFLDGNGTRSVTREHPEFFTNPFRLQNVSLNDWMAYTNAGPFQDPTEVWLNRLALRPMEITNFFNHNHIDWVDKVLRTGVIQDYNVSVSGQSNNFNYFWSVGMLDHRGVIYNNNHRNVRSRINVSNQVTNFLEVGFRGNLSSTNADGQPANLSQAFENSPLGDMFNPDGTFTWHPNEDNMGRNPFEITQRDVYQRSHNLIGAVYARVSLPFGFALESTYNNRWQFRAHNSFRPSFTRDGAPFGGVAEREERRQHDWSIENLLRWNRIIGDIHRFDVVLMQSAAKWRQYLTTAGASRFETSELLGWRNLEMGEIQTASSLDQQDTRASYMGRLNYTLMDRYVLTLTFRRDGFSAFGQDNPWANFPAAAVAWRISEENFMRNIDWISNLGLRFSHGKTGNSNIGRYAALAGVGNMFYLDANKNNIGTLFPTSMANAQLQWEETVASNIGIDFGVFRNRITLTTEFYQQRTTNMLLRRALPSMTGFTGVQANLGRVDNRGIDFTLRTVNVRNNFIRWNSEFVFSLNRNKIRSLYGDKIEISPGVWIEPDDPSNDWFIGHAIDAIRGYKIIGVWQYEEREEALAFGRAPGDFRTYITYGATQHSPDDHQWLGFRRPRFRYGLMNRINLFNSIDISFLLRAETGHVRDKNEINVGGLAGRISQMKFPYWTVENRSNEWGRLGAARLGTIWRDASFLRMEFFNVAYTLPTNLVNRASIQNARVFFNIDNAFVITNNWMYWDVETKAPTPTMFTLGFDITL